MSKAVLEEEKTHGLCESQPKLAIIFLPKTVFACSALRKGWFFQDLETDRKIFGEGGKFREDFFPENLTRHGLAEKTKYSHFFLLFLLSCAHCPPYQGLPCLNYTTICTSNLSCRPSREENGNGRGKKYHRLLTHWRFDKMWTYTDLFLSLVYYIIPTDPFTVLELQTCCMTFLSCIKFADLLILRL